MVKKTKALPKLHIGWREWISFPELGIEKIKAKIDTGARTSAIHAFDIEEVSENGVAMVCFNVHLLQRRKTKQVSCKAKVLDKRKITSSTGNRTERYIIETMVKIGDRSWPIELSLANRDQLGFRVLLGRQAIRNKCVVYAGSSYKMGKL